MSEASVQLPNFEGHEGRECGEHRTTGGRAWCFDCSEWCYENLPCRGCELPMLRSLLTEAMTALEGEHGSKPWHETCPVCETYERIDAALGGPSRRMNSE